MKKKEAIELYKVLNGCKLTGMVSSSKMTVLNNLRKLRPISETYEADIKDAIEKFKPEGFDDLPDFDRRKFRRFRKPIRTKYDYIWPKMKGIEFLIGKDNTSRCWWTFELGRTEEQWREWCLTGKYDPRYYVNERQK